MDETRQLYIISGCNGAGKTTASYTVLPEILLCKEFVNADEIAKGLSPFNPESMAIEAGRLMLKRINELLAAKVSFSIETTLATRSYTRLIQRAQNAGYKVSLIYFWLNSPELAVNRVLQRVLHSARQIQWCRHLACGGGCTGTPALAGRLRHCSDSHRNHRRTVHGHGCIPRHRAVKKRG